MKRILSVSIGSSKRDHKVEAEILGEKFLIERKGTDGSIERAIELIKKFDGKVDAFGMGGIDLYIQGGGRRYIIKDALPLKEAARVTPIVDGSGLKNTLERNVIKYLHQNNIIDFKGKKALVVCAMDRFGMAEALEEVGCKVVCGDMIFALGIPKEINSLKTLHRIARVLAPVACKLPFEVLYPTGKKQESSSSKYHRFFQSADIIAGDFLYINRHIPDLLEGKIVITNTVTAKDVDRLKCIGISMLVTTTPEYGGRSFGTNVMEAVLVALDGSGKGELTPQEYELYLEKIGFQPRIEYLNPPAISVERSM